MSGNNSANNYPKSNYPESNHSENHGEKTMNAENLNFEASLSDISRDLRPGETLILDIGNNYFHQADEIFDTLVMRGFDVKKSFKNGRNQVIVSRKPGM